MKKIFQLWCSGVLALLEMAALMTVWLLVVACTLVSSSCGGDAPALGREGKMERKDIRGVFHEKENFYGRVTRKEAVQVKPEHISMYTIRFKQWEWGYEEFELIMPSWVCDVGDHMVLDEAGYLKFVPREEIEEDGINAERLRAIQSPHLTKEELQ